MLKIVDMTFLQTSTKIDFLMITFQTMNITSILQTCVWSEEIGADGELCYR